MAHNFVGNFATTARALRWTARMRSSHRQLARRLCTEAPRSSMLGASFDQAAALLGGGSGRGSSASDVWSLLRRGDSPLDTAAAAHLPMRTRELAARVFSPPAHTVSAEAASACGTHKALLRLHDGLEVETPLWSNPWLPRLMVT